MCKNAMHKFVSFLGFKSDYERWMYEDCLIYVDFYDIGFIFKCIKGKSFNIYMNPYFHEFDVTRYVYNVLAPGDVFVDVGAMGGLYTIIASKRVGPHGRVLAIEPNLSLQDSQGAC
jgi:hypothetical protein